MAAEDQGQPFIVVDHPPVPSKDVIERLHHYIFSDKPDAFMTEIAQINVKITDTIEPDMQRLVRTWKFFSQRPQPNLFGATDAEELRCAWIEAGGNFAGVEELIYMESISTPPVRKAAEKIKNRYDRTKFLSAVNHLKSFLRRE